MLLLDHAEGVWRCFEVAMPAAVRASAPEAAAVDVARAGEETLLAVLPGVDVSGEMASVGTS